MARIFGAIGRTLIGAGVLLLLFVAYQLWGTGIHEARSQNRLTREFERALASTTTTSSTTPTSTTEPVAAGSSTTSTTTVAPAGLAPPMIGEAVATIDIPEIGMKRTVIEGVGVANLKKGPGHYPQTPMPGQLGNAAIAGHRTTYGAPFYRLNELEKGDRIFVQTLQGSFTYVVDTRQVVRPDQVEVLDATDDARLTLTTCEPRFSARRRLVVTALLGEEFEPAPPIIRSTTDRADGEDDGDDDPVITFDDPAGLSGDPAARWPTFWWGLLTAAVGLAIWFVGTRTRRWPAYLLGAPIFLVVLFVFYENVARLLPANV